MKLLGLASPGLLVSVRSVAEAEAALAGGAALLDVKEPRNGSLGRAPAHALSAILDWVRSRRPVSAAMGEVVEDQPPCLDARLSFIKWGLAGSDRLAWRDLLTPHLQRPGHPQVVVVAYADWQCARAPSLADVVTFACQKSGNVLLIDTHCKDPDSRTKGQAPTLLDWVSCEEIVDVCAQCRSAGVRVALAGSLGRREIKRLKPARPDWLGVRGAVCEGGRAGTVDTGLVRDLARLLHD